MARPFVLASLAVGIFATPAAAQSLPGEVPLSRIELAALRGGFDLPNGMVVTLGVTTETRIDGREVLRTVFDLRGGAPSLTVLANRSDTPDKGLSVVDASGGGARTADGLVQLRSSDAGVTVEFAGDRIDVSHLAGAALGSVIANSASDRSIDVATSVDIGLGGIRPEAIGGSLARVDTLALDATSRMIH